MDALLPMVNKLQDAFAVLGYNPIDLPQIAVVGGQSSGKSSVLENIVGRDFLPRGSGIVTRRPLVLQLTNTTKSKWVECVDESSGKTYYYNQITRETTWKKEDTERTDSQREWGEFLHCPDKKFTNFDEIRKEIEDETDRMTGSNKNISPVPISLRVFSPNVLNLTLVDLPGMTKVAVGDQPSDIGQQIRDMVTEFCSRPNCIMLAVTAANTDLANSDALQLATALDPKGERTVGVITKLDLMDQGTDAREILEGKVFPLQLGYVGVVNRSQKDINEKKDIRNALSAEKQFFENHDAYKHLAHKSGTPFLTKTLNKVLVGHIKNVLPEVRTKVQELLNQKRTELRHLGGEEEMTPEQRKSVLLSSLNTVALDFRNALDGRAKGLPSDQLYGGARIHRIFKEFFVPELLNLQDEPVTPEDVKMLIENASGARTALNVPDFSFEVLVDRGIRRFEDTCLNCAQMVFDELNGIVTDLPTEALSRFEKLRNSVVESSIQCLRKNLEPTNEMIRNIIQMELAYVNTDHPDFLGYAGALQEVNAERGMGAVQAQNPNAGPPSALSSMATGLNQKIGQVGAAAGIGANNMVNQMVTDKMTLDIAIIQRLLKSYLNIARKNIQDMIPKAIMHFLVNKTKESLQTLLLKELYSDDNSESLLVESEEVQQQRKSLFELIGVLDSALKIICEVNDKAISGK